MDHAVASLQKASRQSQWSEALAHTIARKDSFSAVQIRPEQVAAVVLRAAKSKRPHARYRVGALSSFLIRLGALLPVALLDVVLRSMTGLGSKPLTQETNS